MAKNDARKINLDEFPTEIRKQVKDFHDSLAQLRGDLQPLIENYEEIEQSASTPLEQAQLGYTTCYALNSLFWMYLVSIGEKPQEHEIKREIERLKAVGLRLKDVGDKGSPAVNIVHPKVDAAAAKRFVKNALWEAGSSKPTAAKKFKRS
ncbi:Nuclear nucleic acid-binding protein C1D [Halotydeus destructor]|nr:Nuclear nucleic acid-binding protein C1D [Halotydeus destructor]